MSVENPIDNEGDRGQEYWYDRAVEKVQSFLADIDADLRVGMEKRTIHPNKLESYEGWVLHFWHRTNKNINWTTEIKESGDYIDNHLEEVVRKVYDERR